MHFIALLLPFVVHELGHILAALIFREPLKIKRQYLRFVWEMPASFDEDDRKAVAIAGFGCEFFVGIFMNFAGCLYGGIYLAVAVAHLVCYPFYAGEYNDFKFLA